MVVIASHCCATDDGPLRGWLPYGSQMSRRRLSVATADSEIAYSSRDGSSLTTDPNSGDKANRTQVQPLLVVSSTRI